MAAPMTVQRFLDRFRNYRGLAHQEEAVRLLHQAIARGDAPGAVLAEDAAWAVRFSAAAAPPAAPSWPRELNPAGPKEAGMVGPSRSALMNSGDSYLLVNDREQTMEAFDGTGRSLWKIPALARGQFGDSTWDVTNSDTPPGLYRIGKIHRDYDLHGANPAFDRTLRSYGWYSFDLVELENQEARYGRAGMMIHGGGSGNGWPGAWLPRQRLLPTFGCVRCHNIDLRDRILPLCSKGTVYVGVWQEKP